jgi:hypothetical protein
MILPASKAHKIDISTVDTEQDNNSEEDLARKTSKGIQTESSLSDF